MSAYVIVDIEVTEPQAYEEYKRLAQVSVAAHGGRYVVRGGRTETVEGSWTPNRLVVLEFPDLAAARRWVTSEDYAAARAVRRSAARANMVLAEGI